MRVNAHLVESLSSAARHGGSALADAPVLLRRVLEEDAWREFVTQRGEEVRPRSFREFVTTPPLKGLGVDMDLVHRIAGTDDPDLLVMLREAEKVGKPGPLAAGEMHGDSPCISGDDQTALTAARLAREHPEQYAAVKAGERTINAAAVLAGIRPRRISVRLDAPDSIAKSLRRHLTPDQLAQLIALLLPDGLDP